MVSSYIFGTENICSQNKDWNTYSRNRKKALSTFTQPKNKYLLPTSLLKKYSALLIVVYIQLSLYKYFNSFTNFPIFAYYVICNILLFSYFSITLISTFLTRLTALWRCEASAIIRSILSMCGRMLPALLNWSRSLIHQGLRNNNL